MNSLKIALHSTWHVNSDNKPLLTILTRSSLSVLQAYTASCAEVPTQMCLVLLARESIFLLDEVEFVVLVVLALSRLHFLP